MTKDEIMELLIASGAVRVTDNKITLDVGRVAGSWSHDGHEWQRRGGDGDVQDDKDDGQD